MADYVQSNRLQFTCDSLKFGQEKMYESIFCTIMEDLSSIIYPSNMKHEAF